MVVRLPDCLAAARIAFHPATASSDLTREAALSVYRVDYNHAPPGLPAASSVRVEGSYLHLLAGLQVAADGADRADMVAVGGENRFVAGGYPADWTGARVTLRVRGELDAKGARLGLLAQSRVASIDRMVNSVLHFPDPVTAEWAEQTIALLPVACPNAPCAALLTRGTLEKHLKDQCGYRPVCCKVRVRVGVRG